MYFPAGFKVVLLFISRYHQTTNDVTYIYGLIIHMLNTLQINTGIKKHSLSRTSDDYTEM